MSALGVGTGLGAFDREAVISGTGGGQGLPYAQGPDQHAAEYVEEKDYKEAVNNGKAGSTSSTGGTPTVGQQDKEIYHLARRITTDSTRSAFSTADNPFDPQPGSSLDPKSDNFSPRAWAKSLLHLQSGDPDNYKSRTAGICFKDLNVFGFGSATDYQKTVINIVLQVGGLIRDVLGQGQKRRIDILRGLDGVVLAGEMLVVLGPPGSGCSTFLKTVSGETHGFFLDKQSQINYQGISPEKMHSAFRGEAIYTAEVDVHFPMLSVGDTLSFAAQARSPRVIPGRLSRTVYARYMRDVIMAVFGISHTVNTRVGNDFVRGENDQGLPHNSILILLSGVSGGERKRVTIAEAALSGAPLQCWDNSTRGLDSANAIEFCKTLRNSADLVGTTACVAIYQAPQSAYDVRSHCFTGMAPWLILADIR